MKYSILLYMIYVTVKGLFFYVGTYTFELYVFYVFLKKRVTLKPFFIVLVIQNILFISIIICTLHLYKR